VECSVKQITDRHGMGLAGGKHQPISNRDSKALPDTSNFVTQ